MSTPLRVIWSEGLFMTPQHLQQQDRYYEHFIGRRFSALTQTAWGVLRTAIDETALQQGQVTVEFFEGIMPDGLPLELTESSVLPTSRPIDDHFPPIESTLDLYLAMPRTRDGIVNVSSDRSQKARWYRKGRLTHDLLAEADAQEIEFAMPSVVLLFGDEPREGYESVKIAEVIRSEAGAYALSYTYIPPCLRISTSSFLMSGLKRLIGAMTTRQRNLSEAQSEAGDVALAYNVTDVTRFLLLSAVNTYVPVINHFRESGDLSPRELYLVLVQLIGQLSVFAKDFDPASVPKFVYTDLRGTFEPLFALVTYLLHATVEEYFVKLPLESRDDGMHLGEIEDPNFSDCSQFLISVRSSAPFDDIRNKLPHLSKIASWNDMNSILNAAVQGAAIEMAYKPPPQIPIKSGTTYFRIAPDNQYWKNVMVERRLAVYLPDPFSPQETSVSLWGVLEGKKQSSKQGKP